MSGGGEPSGAAAIRRAEARDLPALVRLETLCFPQPWPREALAAEIERARSLVLAAVDAAGWLRGYALFHLLPGEGDLLRLAVHPGHRRRGLAAALLAAGLERLESHGAERCFLEVRADNTAALAFYRATGFTAAGLRRRYYGDGTDALVLTLPFCRPEP